MLDDRGMIAGRSFWIGSDLERDGDRVCSLHDAHQAESAAALANVKGRPLRADLPGEIPTLTLPVLGMRDGKITTRYTRTAVEQAPEMDGVPLLSGDQNSALDSPAEIVEAACPRAPSEAGDIQFVNNHAVYHARTAYDDGDADDRLGRLMSRQWFPMPNSRALPDGFETFWGDVDAGALRDGKRAPTPSQTSQMIA